MVLDLIAHPARSLPSRVEIRPVQAASSADARCRTAAPIAHYNLLERLGAGALGEVYRARDTKVGRTVALRAAARRTLRRRRGARAFLEDARAATALSHPNIAALFDVVEYDGGCYLAYEFASGVDAAAGDAAAARSIRGARWSLRRRSPTRWPRGTRAASCTATSGPTPSS